MAVCTLYNVDVLTLIASGTHMCTYSIAAKRTPQVVVLVNLDEHHYLFTKPLGMVFLLHTYCLFLFWL